MLGALVNNLSATTSYVSGVDRTEYQDGNARNFSFALDYLVADDSASIASCASRLEQRRARRQSVPLESDAAPRDQRSRARIGSSRVVHQARGRRRRSAVGEQRAQPAVAKWQRVGVPSDGRPDRALGGAVGARPSRLRRHDGTHRRRDARASAVVFGANAGFERERSMLTSVSWQPSFSSWLRPRAEVGTQYNMLRDPNDRSLIPLPGVVGVDSVLATRDSLALASSLTLPRRLTAAQTSSVGTSIDVARAFSLHTSDSTLGRRLWRPVLANRRVVHSQPPDRARRDAGERAAEPPIRPRRAERISHGERRDGNDRGADRRVERIGIAATPVRRVAGQSVQPHDDRELDRPNGRESGAGRWLAASVPRRGGAVGVSSDRAEWRHRQPRRERRIRAQRRDGLAAESRRRRAGGDSSHEHRDLPGCGCHCLGGAWASEHRERSSASRRRIDSLPGSVARTRGNDLSLDAGRVFFVPASWQLGIHDDLRTRISYQQTHNTTSVFDENGGVRARLQDNGRQAFTLTADSNINEFVVLTLNGSHIVTFDNNLNRRFAYTVFSTVFQVQFFGAGK